MRRCVSSRDCVYPARDERDLPSSVVVQDGDLEPILEILDGNVSIDHLHTELVSHRESRIYHSLCIILPSSVFPLVLTDLPLFLFSCSSSPPLLTRTSRP